MTTSTTARRTQGTLGIGRNFLLGAAGLALILGAAVGVRSLDGNGSAPAISPATVGSLGSSVEPVIYVFESTDQADEVRMWHMADAATANIPFDFMVAGTPEEDATVDHLLHEIGLYSPGAGPKIQDFRVR